MARYTNFHELLDELKLAITDGIEETGLVCTDGSPVYGGTGSGEDFDGLNIYMESLDDHDDGMLGDKLTVPFINIDGEEFPQESFLDYGAMYSVVLQFEIRLNMFNKKTKGADTLRARELGDFYVQKLKYLLDRFIPTSVMLMERPDAETSKHSGKDSNEAFYTAWVFYSFAYFREV